MVGGAAEKLEARLAAEKDMGEGGWGGWDGLGGWWGGGGAVEVQLAMRKG